MASDTTTDLLGATARKGREHHWQESKSDTYLTPPEIIRALGAFDLDPCCPLTMPWKTAERHYTRRDNGLLQPWTGRVWLNPPFGPPKIIAPWMRRMATHARGTALILARTETAMFFETVWRAPSAIAILFLEKRPHFHDETGQRWKDNSGAPVVLIAYGAADADILETCGLAGAFLRLPRAP